MLSVKSPERLYTKGVVYNGYIQICKKTGICILSRIHGTLTKEWPILANSLELKEDRSKLVTFRSQDSNQVSVY